MHAIQNEMQGLKFLEGIVRKEYPKYTWLQYFNVKMKEINQLSQMYHSYHEQKKIYEINSEVNELIQYQKGNYHYWNYGEDPFIIITYIL